AWSTVVTSFTKKSTRRKRFALPLKTAPVMVLAPMSSPRKVAMELLLRLFQQRLDLPDFLSLLGGHLLVLLALLCSRERLSELLDVVGGGRRGLRGRRAGSGLGGRLDRLHAAAAALPPLL